MTRIIRNVERREEERLRSFDSIHRGHDATTMVDVRRNKYQRKVLSRTKRAKRQRTKREHGKWNGKSDNVRIRRKMRKYVAAMDV